MGFRKNNNRACGVACTAIVSAVSYNAGESDAIIECYEEKEKAG